MIEEFTMKNQKQGYNVIVAPVPRLNWNYGRVIDLIGTYGFLLKSQQGGTVFLHKDKLSKYCLELRKGDEVEFVLNIRNKSNKPSVAKVKPLVLMVRSEKEFLEYFDQASQYLTSRDCSNAVIDILSLPAMWHLFVASSMESCRIAFR